MIPKPVILNKVALMLKTGYQNKILQHQCEDYLKTGAGVTVSSDCCRCLKVYRLKVKKILKPDVNFRFMQVIFKLYHDLNLA